MQLGMIGLGRIGGNMVRRLMRAGHECVGTARGAQIPYTRLRMRHSAAPQG
jgi:6-phosphogluconate dehydrogenase (decarboxylating)